MRRSVVIAGFATAALLLSAVAEGQVDKDIKIGVPGDIYPDIGAPGSVAAAKMAVADFSSYLLQAPTAKARIIVPTDAGPDRVNTITRACGGDIPGTARQGGLPGDYGDVEYADPGYQGDKKKRYPIDTEKHIRAAWSYINKPKNAGKYSTDELKRIKNKIIAAWKDKIGPEGPPSAAPPR
jgi:hypothetical protein